MQNIDEAHLQEIYKNITLNARIEQLVAEGKSVEQIDEIMLQEAPQWWSNVKAKTASAAETIKGLGTTTKGVAQQAAGKVVGKTGELATKGFNALGMKDAEGKDIKASDNALMRAGANLQQTGQQNVQSVKDAATNAKVNSVIKSYEAEANRLATNIVQSCQKLGIPFKYSAEDVARTVRGQIINELQKALVSKP